MGVDVPQLSKTYPVPAPIATSPPIAVPQPYDAFVEKSLGNSDLKIFWIEIMDRNFLIEI